MSIKFTTIPAKSLYQPLLSTDVTFKLADITGFSGNDLTSSDFGTVGYGVLLNSDRSVMELFSWDPTTIASTSISFVDRGLPFDGDDTPVTAYKLDWPAGSTVLLGSDTPQFIQWLKDYIDGIAIAGSPNASTTTKGIVEEATQAERDAGTGTGATGARLFGAPSTERGKLINDYAVDASGTDAYEITITPAITAYSAGQRFSFKAGTANTGPATLNVSGLGAKTIKKDVSSDLVTGDILANQIVEVEYDGTNMQLVSSPSGVHDATLLIGLVPTASLSQLPSTSSVGTGPASSTTQTITHGLGRIPKTINITGLSPSIASLVNEPDTTSIGVYSSSGNTCVYRSGIGSGSQVNPSSSTSFSIYLTDADLGNIATGVIGNVGATTFDIVWTIGTGTSVANAKYLWIAQ